MGLNRAAGSGRKNSLGVEAFGLQHTKFWNQLCRRTPAGGKRGLAVVPAKTVRGSAAGV